MRAFICLLTQHVITDSADKFRLRILHPSNADVILKTVCVGLGYSFSSQSTEDAS